MRQRQLGCIRRSVRSISGSTQSRCPRVAVIGAGNFGTTIARRISLNLIERFGSSGEELKLWVYEDKLVDIINQYHINPKYLAGIPLPTSIRAYSDIRVAAKDVDYMLLAVSPDHLHSVLQNMTEVIQSNKSNNINTIPVSLMKGIGFNDDKPVLLSDTIREHLGVAHVAVMMGANIASDIAYDKLVETTVACRDENVAKDVARVLSNPLFNVDLTTDVSTTEYCGALKNIYALGAGFCDGMGVGASTKAALMRQGLKEMAIFSQIFDVNGTFSLDTIFLSCGVADLFATCAGGRNRLCAAAFANQALQRRNSSSAVPIDTLGRSNQAVHASFPSGWPLATGPSSGNTGDMTSGDRRNTIPTEAVWEEIEKELLNGQKLQGVNTCVNVVNVINSTPIEKLRSFHWITQHIESNNMRQVLFPLLYRIHDIACNAANLNTLFDWYISTND